jgi:hypothetical protein
MKVITALVLSLVSAAAMAFTDLGAVLSIQKMADGTYQAICTNQSFETLTDLDLRLGNMCPQMTDTSSLQILSVQSRGDGLYNVICADNSFRAGISREKIMTGEACR